MSKDAVSSFYLSAVTPQGFVTRLSSLRDAGRPGLTVLLKGGTPALRSALLEQAAAGAERAGLKVGRVLSAVNEGGLEAVFWEGRAVLDSAYPYCVEPLYPAALEEVVWLGGCYDAGPLQSRRGELAELLLGERRLAESGRRYLAAAAALLDDNRRAAFECADPEKIKRQAARLAAKCLAGPGGQGEERRFITSGRFGAPGRAEVDLSGFSVTAVQDDCGGCARLLLDAIYNEAKSKSADFWAGFGPLSPFCGPELLIFPQTGQAFIYEQGSLPLRRAPDRVINSRRFTDRARLSQRGERIRLNKKAAGRMIERAGGLFGEAAALREQTEQICRPALDLQALGRLSERLADPAAG